MLNAFSPTVPSRLPEPSKAEACHSGRATPVVPARTAVRLIEKRSKVCAKVRVYDSGSFKPPWTMTLNGEVGITGEDCRVS